MTAANVVNVFNASIVSRSEEMSILAYRTALYTRTKKFPKSEADLLKKAKPKAAPKPQTIQDQLAMAQFITVAMGGTVH
jgi:hypothetical protein